MSLTQLRKAVNEIMYNHYDEEIDLYDMFIIVVDRLITDFMCDDYIVRCFSETIKTLIEEWISQNTND